MMKKLLLVIGLVAIVVAGTAGSGSSRFAVANPTQVSAAASGVFPSGATFAGLPLSGSTLGVGVVIQSTGKAVGEFETVLAATSLLGQPQSITLEAEATAGVANPDGSVTFSGNGTLDMGNGSAPTTVPFTVAATTSGLQLTIGATALPTQTLGAGSIFIG
jgi:hypothetical protein